MRKEKSGSSSAGGKVSSTIQSPSGGGKSSSPAPKDVKPNNNNNKANVPEDNAPGVQDKKAQKEPAKSFSRKKLEKLFAKYKDEGEGDPVIGPEGIEKFCGDLEISAEDVLVLVMAYHLNAQEMGYFTQTEFIDGFEKLGLDSIESIKNQLSKFKAQLEDQETFKAIYRFAFFFAKDEPEKKVVEMEIAAGMLGLVMGEKYPLAKSFVEFLKVQDSYKALNLDQWMSFYEFCKVVNADFSNYDENSAWPCIIDEWVEWRKSKESDGED